MDMILEKNYVFSGAIETWNKWVQVIMEYAGSLSGRKASVLCDVRKKCEGALVFFYGICIYNSGEVPIVP